MRGSIELSGSLWTVPNSLRRRETASGRKRTARLSTQVLRCGLGVPSGKTATVVGKLEPAFIEAALGGLGLEAKDVAMVGDDAESDVAGAQRAGLRSVQVKTGKYWLGAVGRRTGRLRASPTSRRCSAFRRC
jgi:ribonucleotide monophosphatase NagD (HAD superfamily)